MKSISQKMKWFLENSSKSTQISRRQHEPLAQHSRPCAAIDVPLRAMICPMICRQGVATRVNTGIQACPGDSVPFQPGLRFLANRHGASVYVKQNRYS